MELPESRRMLKDDHDDEEGLIVHILHVYMEGKNFEMSSN